MLLQNLPLNYYYYVESYKTEDEYKQQVTNLTTNFFGRKIVSPAEENEFYQCGFKKSKDGEKIENTTELKQLFTNTFTDLDENDSPKIEIPKTNDFFSNQENLQKILCDGQDNLTKYARFLLNSEETTSIYEYGPSPIDGWDYHTSDIGIIGIRPIITINKNAKFTKSSTEVNDRTTWEINL